MVKKEPINEALPLLPIAGKVLIKIALNPKTVAAFGQLAAMGVATAARGVSNLQHTIWSKGWIKLYAKVLKKQYGEDFMKMVHDLSASKQFKTIINNRDHHLQSAKTPEQKKAIDDKFTKELIKMAELEFPEHTKMLQQGAQETKKNILNFVDKEYNFKYNPKEPGTGDPEFPQRQQQYKIRRKNIGKYKDALRKATIVNPKTGNKIKLVTALNGKNYDDEFKQQAKAMAQQLMQKNKL